MKKIYFIISAYNEEQNLDVLIQALTEELKRVYVHYEMVFVNDGSTDHTLTKLCELQTIIPEITIINQSKNFGHELAMTAGLHYVVEHNKHSEYAVIFMDADLQHPPKIAVELIQLWLEGERLVLTRRTDNLEKSLRYKMMGNLYYWILNLISDVKIPRNMPDFRLLDKKYVVWMNTLNENDRMFRGMLSLIGLRDAKVVDFVAPKRFQGKSHYKFYNLLKLAIDSVIQFSVKPLKIATFIGIFGCFISFLFVLYSIYLSYIQNEPRTGFLTLLCVSMFFSSITIFFLGVIGEYIGRIHIQVKNRPLYFSEVIKKQEEYD